FFQAEDGIRDFHVTGVQTCALPILVRCSLVVVGVSREQQQQGCSGGPDEDPFLLPFSAFLAGRERPVLRVGGPRGEGGHRWSGRSEERRVGKECRSGGGWADDGEKG